MRAMKLVPTIVLSLGVLCAMFLLPVAGTETAGPSSRPGPEEVRALQGVYTGSWTMHGIDDRDQIAKRMAWTDVMKVDSPRIEGDRAFVSTMDEMTFEGGRIPPVKVQGQEGYFLKPDGGLGDYFIETFGQVTRMTRLADNVWVYAAQAPPQELAQLGFPSGASGQHVLVKVITREQDIETHRISRLTTVVWVDKKGEPRTLQFVSLQGFHKRQP